jgi:hypothetical protein
MNSDFYDRMSEMFSSGMTNAAIQQQLKKEYPEMHPECIRSRVRNFGKRKNMVATVVNKDSVKKDATEEVHSFEYKSDGSAVFEKIIALPKSENITPEKVLEAHGLDKDLWEIISCKSNFYQQQKKGGSIINLYQSKITAKPIHFAVSLDDVKSNFDSLQNKFKPIKVGKPNSNAKYMYEINIADLHLGKFACDLETGEMLNSEIAERRFFDIIEKECDNISQYGEFIEKILFVWTNDFFNSDGISSATTGGTPQDTDMKWQKLYITGVNMLIKAIDKLSQYAPVKTFYIASNHSRQVDYYAICTLNAWFRNYSNVEVDINPSPRHYERYGVNLIGFAHSYYEKKQNLPHLMSVERKEDWGQTSYREYHLAHYHSEKVEEKGGVIFRWLPSVTGDDSWITETGYIGSVKRSYSFVYDKEKGLVQINSTIVD